MEWEIRFIWRRRAWLTSESKTLFKKIVAKRADTCTKLRFSNAHHPHTRSYPKLYSSVLAINFFIYLDRTLIYRCRLDSKISLSRTLKEMPGESKTSMIFFLSVKFEIKPSSKLSSPDEKEVCVVPTYGERTHVTFHLCRHNLFNKHSTTFHLCNKQLSERCSNLEHAIHFGQHITIIAFKKKKHLWNLIHQFHFSVFLSN